QRPRANLGGRARRAPAGAHPQESRGVAEAEAPPAQPRVVARLEAPGAGAGIVMAPAPPGPVPVARAVHDGAIVRYAAQVRRDVPDPLIARVVAPARENDLRVGVDRVLQTGARDGRELRGPVVIHVEAPVVTLNRAGLWNLGVRDGVLGLVRARHARQDVALG